MKEEVPVLSRYVAECLGTLVLVFLLGCSAHTESVAISLSVGSVLTALIYGLCHISGGHFNPAVTLALYLADRTKIPFGTLVGYMLSQAFGGLLGAYVYFHAVGRTLLLRPIGLYSDNQVAAVEVIYSTALCYVFLNVALCGVPGSSPHYGFAIGSSVTAAAIAVGPISGCSLNPAVASGSLFVAWALYGPGGVHHAFLYLSTPFLGSFIAWLLFFLAGGGAVIEVAAEKVHLPLDALAPGRSAEGSPLLGAQLDARLRAAAATAMLPPATAYGAAAESSAVRAQMNSLRVLKHAPVELSTYVLDRELFFACRWRVRTTENRGDPVPLCDIDLSCVKLNKAGDHMGGVYFAEAKDNENGIRHSGDEIMGEGMNTNDNELILFRLSDIKPGVFALVFVVGIYDEGQKFGDVSELCARLVDNSTGSQEICRYEKKDFLPQANALVAAMLYREGGTWIFKAVDESFVLPPHSSYRKLLPEMKELCRKCVAAPRAPRAPQSPSSPSGSHAA